MQSNARWPKEAGMTLMELLVVLTVLALIAALAGPQLLKYVSGAKASTAQTQIENLVSATELYYLDTGRYPDAEQGLTILVQPPERADEDWNGPYLSKAAGIIDPWGNPYYLRAPGRVAAFEIYTYGADGIEGGVDDARDIYSWEIGSQTAFRKSAS